MKSDYIDDRVRNCKDEILCICIRPTGPVTRYCYKNYYQYKIDCKGIGMVNCTPYAADKRYYSNDCGSYETDCNCAVANTWEN
jgi:hypothetical protein